MHNYYNRELSWLGFNYRVLQEAAAPSVPLFERLKFLSIFSSNLDEFFRVRYPAAIALTSLKKKTQKQITGEWTHEILEKIQAEITRQLEEFGTILLRNILPGLKEIGINLYYNEPIRQGHKEEVADIFLSQVLSFIQPLLLDGKKKFNPENNQLYFAIALKKTSEELIRHAIVNIPSDKLPRFFILSSIDDTNYVIFIDDIIRENMQTIFPGFEILSIYSFKINRDAELNLEEEYDIDILNKIEKQLTKRNFGPPSRFLFETGMPQIIQLFLISVLDIRLDEIFAGGRYHKLKDIASLHTFSKNLILTIFYYSLLITLNFNETTARFYTDHVLLTADKIIAKELLQLFEFLQKRRLPVDNRELRFQKLLVSQFNMIEKFDHLIEEEISKTKKGEGGLIRI